MKKYLYLLLMPLLAIASCEKPMDEPDQEPGQTVGEITLMTDETSVVLPGNGGSEQIPFTASLDWTASADKDFVTVEPKSGQAGESAVTISVGENPDYEDRTGTVTITCGEDSKTIQVTQKYKGALVIAESVIAVEAEGKTVTITAQANSDVTATIALDAQEWISEVKTKAVPVDYIFQFEVKANESETPRSGKIVFKNETGSQTVTIEQAGVEIAKANITSECVFASSSSLVFEWTNGAEEVAEVAALPYKIYLYKDEACEDLVV